MWKGSLLRVYTYFLPQGSEFAIFTLLNFSLASPSTHPLCYWTLSKHDTRKKEEVETQRSVFFHLHAFNNNERICTHHILLLLPFFSSLLLPLYFFLLFLHFLCHHHQHHHRSRCYDASSFWHFYLFSASTLADGSCRCIKLKI